MSRFQALTNSVLDAELEMLRDRLGLEPNQRADLLREVAALAGWVVRQAEQGRAIEARRGDEVEPLVHPAIERLRARRQKPAGERLTLSDAEAMRLASVLDQGFEPPPALREALANLASPKRRPPRLRWKKPAV
ncbi:hypothetical protein WMF31_30735 [Sorangium sp. So ce1036]|uniref:hypothetical protein n=1 Tax=Sorangium sp. So ce1036 TaxID=3133328 RepID=UPI003F085FBD